MPCFSHCLSKYPFAGIQKEKGCNTFCYLPESKNSYLQNMKHFLFLRKQQKVEYAICCTFALALDGLISQIGHLVKC